MSAKNNLGEAHENRLLHPLQEEQERKTEGNVEGGGKPGGMGWGGQGGGSETLTHSHAGLSGPLPFLPPAQITTASPPGSARTSPPNITIWLLKRALNKSSPGGGGKNATMKGSFQEKSIPIFLNTAAFMSRVM